MKKMILPIIALALGIGFSAFTVGHSSKHMDGQLWYSFVGTDVDNPNDYALLGDGTQAPSCDANTDIRCAVLAEPSTGSTNHPDLSDPDIEIRNKVQ